MSCEDWRGEERRSSYPALQTSLQTDREHLEHCLVAAGWTSLRQLRHCLPPPAPDTAQGPLTAARAERTVSPGLMSLVATRPRPAPGISATLKGSVSADILRAKAGVRLTVTRSHVDCTEAARSWTAASQRKLYRDCQLLFPFFLFLSFHHFLTVMSLRGVIFNS